MKEPEHRREKKLSRRINKYSYNDVQKTNRVEKMIVGVNERLRKLKKSCLDMKDSINATKDAIEKTMATACRRREKQK